MVLFIGLKNQGIDSSWHIGISCLHDLPRSQGRVIHKQLKVEGPTRLLEPYWNGPTCMVCPLAPMSDELSITASEIEYVVILTTCPFATHHLLVLALTAWSDGGVLVRMTKLLATPAGARSPRGPSSLNSASCRGPGDGVVLVVRPGAKDFHRSRRERLIFYADTDL